MPAAEAGWDLVAERLLAGAWFREGQSVASSGPRTQAGRLGVSSKRCAGSEVNLASCSGRLIKQACNLDRGGSM